MTVPVRSDLPEEHFEYLYRLGERHNVTVGSLVAELVRRHLAGECVPPKQKSTGKPLAPKVVKQILDLHHEGRSDLAIARTLGLVPSTVKRYRNEAGLPPHVRYVRLPTETVAAIRDLYAEGLSDLAIGRLLGVGNKRVGNYRNSLGLPKNVPGGRKKQNPQIYPLADPAQAGADTREKTT